jgi:hypothetical protein
MLESKTIPWRIETFPNLLDQVAAVTCFAGDPLVAFSSGNLRWDLTSGLDDADGHDKLHLFSRWH